jgi:branched-chain amino acid transport system ATP-binding protein
MTLAISKLTAGYGKAQALFDVSLQVAPGEVLVLLGRNGAGKTTTLKAAMGWITPWTGEVTLHGQSIRGKSMHEIARLGLGFVPEERRIFSDLTVAENLTVGVQPARKNAPTWTQDRVFDLFPKLKEMQQRLGGQMSGGEQQMLTIARTLMGNPSVLLLDEPSEGLAPIIVERIAQSIMTLKREGLSIILSEQNYHFAQWVADRAVVVDKGHVRFEGTMADLVANADVRKQFLSV